jgi:TolA-binding protein
LLEVTPNLKRRWFVDVGPFEVTVKGTAFSVSWDPLDERFELDLRHGRVLVRGPVSAGEITMRGGQRLVVSLPKAEAVLTEGPQKDREPAMAPTAEGSDHSPPQAEAATPAEAPLPRVLTPSRGGKLAGTHRWRDDLARGEWDRILDEVKRIGVEATLAKASSDDLFAVADAARYRRHSDLARAALLSVRRRFPEAPRALNALYLLGRVEESRQGGVTEAIAWYDEYLSHVPTGALAGEALGRKMVLTERAQGGARARPIAEEYLRRFSSGSYAASARALSGVPGQGP